jgi:hypothetical protein
MKSEGEPGSGGERRHLSGKKKRSKLQRMNDTYIHFLMLTYLLDMLSRCSP